MELAYAVPVSFAGTDLLADVRALFFDKSFIPMLETEMKPGDKVWLILEGWCTVGEIVSGTIEYITGDLAMVSFDFRMNPRGVSLKLLFPTREALCEHYRKIFE